MAEGTLEALRLALDEIGRLQADAGARAGRLDLVGAALLRARERVGTLERRCRVLRDAALVVRDGPEVDLGPDVDAFPPGGWPVAGEGTFYAVTEAGRAALAAASGTVN